ncbi:MAG: GNAT family N-acetyltransferase [Eubacteriales bacterium]|nr:GNAT family N-acetyltransferase [Eubacteriales bacterium]
MIFRNADERDIKRIMEMICQAQEDLKSQGVDQWQAGYPNEEIVQEDIRRRENFVMEQNGEIVATVVFSFEKEPSYENIYDGKWQSEDPYAVIHRIAVDRSKKKNGVATEMLEEIIKKCHENKILSIRIDTHRDNHIMQSWIAKNHFSYCGVIYLKSDGTARNAYERRL